MPVKNRLQVSGAGCRVRAAVVLLVLVTCSALGGSLATASPGGRIKGVPNATPNTTIFADGCEAGNMDVFDFVWKDNFSPPFYWHCQTSVVKDGTYAMQAHYAHDGEANSPLAAPSLSQVACAGAGGNRFVKVVIVRPNTPTGKINAYFTSEANLTVSASNCLRVTSPAAGQTFWHYDVYAGSATGDSNLKLQNTTPIAVGTNWTEPDGGLANNGNYPAGFTEDATSLTRHFTEHPRPNQGIGLHIFKSAWFYFKTPETGGDKDIDRKLMRSTNEQSQGDSCPAPSCWEGVLTSLDTDTTGIALRYTNQGDGCSQQNAFTSTEKMAYDTWYHIEVEELMNNPPASSNATIRVWVTPDGGATSLWGENTAFRVRCAADEPIGMVQFGDQTQTGVGEKADEIRRIDRIRVARSYQGP